MIPRYFAQYKEKKGLFFECNIDKGSLVGDMDFREYSFNEVPAEAFGRDEIFDEKERFRRFLDYSKSGHRCFAFFTSTGSIASYLWLSVFDREVQIPWELNLKLLLKPGSAYIWNCVTKEEHRRKGLYKNGLKNARSICFRKGIKKVYICSIEDRDPSKGFSKKGIISAGFREKFSFSVSKIGPLRLIKKSDSPIKIKKKGSVYDVIAP
ncbi:MAG: GNAT family N-acetyltransferase [Candidatus Omnitrophica bacterium]|nr:GNAT family N-acetyltransferase [Candidatus Omnitrophota bacterium]